MLPLPRPRSGPGSTPPLAFWGELASDRPSGGPGAPGRAPRPPVVTNSRVRWPTSRCRAHPRPGRGPGPAKRRSRKCAQHLSHGRACGKTRVRAVREWGSEGGSLALAAHRNPASTCWLEKSVKSIYVKKPERRMSLQVYSQDGPRPAGTFRTTHVVELKI